jgi:hypothetical protein
MKLTTDRKQLQKFITPRISNQNSQINSLYKGIEKVQKCILMVWPISAQKITKMQLLVHGLIDRIELDADGTMENDSL